MLEEGQNGGKALPPPPPPTYTKNKAPAGRKSCCRCICCFCIFFFLLILTLTLLAFYLYSVTNPQIPSYTITDLQVMDLRSSHFLMTLKADNPNANIGFIYGLDSSVNVVHEGADVCDGNLPHFHQGPRNVSIMGVHLVGKSEFGSGLQEAFMENKVNSDKIPLLVKVKVPVRIVVGEFALREFKVFVNCSLVVDNLAPNNKINILSTHTTYDYEL